MFLVQTQSNCTLSIPSKLKCYQIIEQISNGFSSVVFKVQQVFSKKIFAAKILSIKDMENKKLTDIVYKKIQILRSIKHPNIIRLYDVFNIKNEQNEEFKVMIEEYCSQGTLLDYLTEHDYPNENIKKKMMRNIIEAVSYIHQKMIAHCDIKLENILLDDNFNIKLCDFGFAKDLTKNYNQQKSGTYNYAAPELFTHGNVDFIKADIWALGVTLYCMEEKHFPYEDICQFIRNGDTNVSMRNQTLKNIIEDCFNLIPYKRPDALYLLKISYFSFDDKKVVMKEPTITREINNIVENRETNEITNN